MRVKQIIMFNEIHVENSEYSLQLNSYSNEFHDQDAAYAIISLIIQY